MKGKAVSVFFVGSIDGQIFQMCPDQSSGKSSVECQWLSGLTLSCRETTLCFVFLLALHTCRLSLPSRNTTFTCSLENQQFPPEPR